MLMRMPDEELPEPDHVVINTGKVYKEGQVRQGPASRDWPSSSDDKGLSE